MDVSEFIDTYSDDLVFLHEWRSALLTHPLNPAYAFAELVDASACRIAAVFMIGGIEAMIEAWRDRDRVGVLEMYFADKVKNGQRVDSLREAFVGAGINVDRSVFDDYLAIKYLRNTIVHGRWKDYEKEWLDARGFPTDTRKLTKHHFDRIEHVYQNMMLYILLTSHPRKTTATPDKPAKLIKLDDTLTRRRDETGILLRQDIDRIIWNNLERIDAHLYAEIERTAVTERYNWTGGRSRTDLDLLAEQEVKRLFYLAARRAGEEGYEPLAQHRALAKEALAFWQEYWQRAIQGHGLAEGGIRRALDMFETFHRQGLYTDRPLWPLIENMPDEMACRVVEAAIGVRIPFTSEQILHTLRMGHLAWKLIPNVMPVTLLTLRLPIVDPGRTLDYLSEAKRAFSAFKLNLAWHYWVEHRHAPPEEGLNFYSRMSHELAERGRDSEHDGATR